MEGRVGMEAVWRCWVTYDPAVSGSYGGAVCKFVQEARGRRSGENTSESASRR